MSTTSGRRRASFTLLAALVAAAGSAGASHAAAKKPKAKATTTTAPAAAPTTAAPAASATTVAGGSATTVAAKKAEKVGDTLTISVGAAPNSLNPALANVGTSNANIQPTYASLLYMNPDRSYSGDLAEKWGYTDEFNEQFELTLRAGLKFADGTPLDGAAAAASLNYYLKNGLNRAAWLSNVTSITNRGNTVVVKASAPTPDLERVFSSDKFAGAIISAAGLADPTKMATASFGAGAYVLDSGATTPGSVYTMVPNKNFWNPSQQHWKKIVVKVVADNNAAIQAMQTGQIDFTQQLTGAQLAAAKSAGLNIDLSAGATFYAVLADRGGELTPAVGDLKVRQAMNTVIDRAATCKAVFGDAAVPQYQLQAAGMDGYDAELDKLYPFDANAAKKLMAESGFAGGFKLGMESAAQAGFNVLGSAVAQQWKALGIDVDMTNSPNVPAGQALHAAKKFSVYISANGLNSTPLLAGLHVFSPGNRFNPWATSDPKVNDVFKQAFALSNAADANKLYKQAWRRVAEQAWYVPLCNSNTVIAATKGLSGWEVPKGGNPPTALDVFPS